MKTLADGNEVTSRTFYYLLDWRDRHHDERPLQTRFGKEKLHELTLNEYINLFYEATIMDRVWMENKLK